MAQEQPTPNKAEVQQSAQTAEKQTPKSLAERFPGVKSLFKEARKETQEDPLQTLKDVAEVTDVQPREPTVLQKARALVDRRYAGQLEQARLIQERDARVAREQQFKQQEQL